MLTPSQAAVSLRDYKVLRTIGSGASSKVYLAEHEVSKCRVAIKVISNLQINSSDRQTRLAREMSFLQRMDHPCVCRFFEFFSHEGQNCFVMEYAEKGNLMQYVTENGPRSETEAKKIFTQIVAALEYIHVTHKIVHRDLKPENILLDRNMNIRLVDFGLSNIFSPNSQKLSTACGSRPYASPEMIIGERYGTSTDIWSLGVLLYWLTVGTIPFVADSIDRLTRMIVYEQPSYPLDLSSELKDLLRGLLQKKPQNRILISQIKSHPWFSKHEYAIINELVLFREEHLSPDSNPEILAKLQELEIDCSSLSHDYISKQQTPATIIYEQFFCEFLLDRTVSIAETINRTPFTFTDTALYSSTHKTRYHDTQLEPAYSLSASPRRSAPSAQYNRRQNPTPQPPRLLPQAAPVPYALRRYSKPQTTQGDSKRFVFEKSKEL